MKEHITKEQIVLFLQDLGMRQNLAGFDCAVAVLCEIEKQEDFYSVPLMQYYRDAALNVTTKKIEESIRYSIAILYKDKSKKYIESVLWKIGEPSNGNFLMAVIRTLRAGRKSREPCIHLLGGFLCKECVWWQEDDHFTKTCILSDVATSEDDFCSIGERKDDENEKGE